MVAPLSQGPARPRPERRELLGVLDVLPAAGALLIQTADDRGPRFETVHANELARHLGVTSSGGGDPLLDLLSPNERERLLLALSRTFQEGAPLQERVTLRRLIAGDDGPSETPVIISGGPVGGHLLVFLTTDVADGLDAVNRAELEDARQDARRLEVLQRVTAALVSADTVEKASTIILDELFFAKPLVAGVVAVRDDDEEALFIAASRGVTADGLARRARLPLDDDQIPVVVAARTGEPAWLSSRAEVLAAYPSFFRHSREAVTQAIAVLPLEAERGPAGALALSFAQPTRFDDDLRKFLQTLARQCARAIERARLYDETQNAVRVRDDFLSIAGHELRTPLTALHLQLQALVRSPSRASSAELVQERARRMAQQTDRLSRLITELLDVSRIVRGRLTLERSEVDLVEVLRGTLELCHTDLQRAGCPLEIDAPPSLVGRWDRTRVEQVLQNLIVNACKYGKGSPVEVSVRAEGERAVIIVRDHGIGISPEDQLRIFERFERAVPSTQFGGFGLGLWISRQVVEAHGGSISVDSAPGKGATFRVMLPRTQRSR